uniref:Putative secreted peptide n=1 Tax=Anopheles braziliensis TaxID=58242 RepID=A0A2M3ZN80_9DIPT
MCWRLWQPAASLIAFTSRIVHSTRLARSFPCKFRSSVSSPFKALSICSLWVYLVSASYTPLLTTYDRLYQRSISTPFSKHSSSRSCPLLPCLA